MMNLMSPLFDQTSRVFLLLVLSSVFVPLTGMRDAWAQEPVPVKPKATAESAGSKEAEQAEETERARLAKESRASAASAIDIVGQRIKAATNSRATVELTASSKIGDEIVGSEKSVYQIASLAPNSYTAFLKSPAQSIRIFCDGKSSVVSLSPTAYYKSPVAESIKSVVTFLPVPLGPYPEPVMALTLCGVDPKESLMTDMESIEIVDRDPYNNTAAVHLHGVQLDGVSWDLWLATEKEQAQPLRMVVDLTKVISNGEDNQLPDDFAYELEFLFTLWRVNGEVAPSLFSFTPSKDAKEYESLEDYNQSVTSEAQPHVLTGQPAPDFEALLYQPAADGNEGKSQSDSGAAKVKLSDLKGKVVVLDFWATWCGPCINAMPVISRVASRFADRDVTFYAVNAGETAEVVKQFFETSDAKPNVLLDPSGEIANAFLAEAIPQTVIVGKDGRIEIVHVGYLSLESLEKEIGEQLEVLANGGTLLPDPATN
jgi:thiol-disulfide isomerase/thioredoxin